MNDGSAVDGGGQSLPPGEVVTQVPLSELGRQRLRSAKLRMMALPLVLLATFAVASAAALSSSKPHKDAAVVLAFLAAALLVIAGFSYWAFARFQRDVRAGIMNCYAGSWEERVVRSQFDYVEFRLPIRRRVFRTNNSTYVVAAAQAGTTGEWRSATGRMHFGQFSKLLLEVERDTTEAVQPPRPHLESRTAAAPATDGETAKGTTGGPPGPHWASDPLGRHEQRYWNGLAWTMHVADAGSISTDAVQLGTLEQ